MSKRSSSRNYLPFDEKRPISSEEDEEEEEEEERGHSCGHSGATTPLLKRQSNPSPKPTSGQASG